MPSPEPHSPEFNRINRYTYHAPSQVGIERHAALSELFIATEAAIAEIVPEGREMSIVKTKLEEAKFWASAGVARNPSTR